jgi:hypothetical protein
MAKQEKPKAKPKGKIIEFKPEKRKLSPTILQAS